MTQDKTLYRSILLHITHLFLLVSGLTCKLQVACETANRNHRNKLRKAFAIFSSACSGTTQQQSNALLKYQVCFQHMRVSEIGHVIGQLHLGQPKRRYPSMANYLHSESQNIGCDHYWVPRCPLNCLLSKCNPPTLLFFIYCRYRLMSLLSLLSAKHSESRATADHTYLTKLGLGMIREHIILMYFIKHSPC